MRLGDLDELKENIEIAYKRGDIMQRLPIIAIIDNAPTIEPFEPDHVGAERLKARQRGYEEGYHNGMEIGKTLNPKIKQGEWISNGGNGFYNPGRHCSLCGKVVEFSENFCPKCGAEMQKGGKNE